MVDSDGEKQQILQTENEGEGIFMVQRKIVAISRII